MQALIFPSADISSCESQFSWSDPRRHHFPTRSCLKPASVEGSSVDGGEHEIISKVAETSGIKGARMLERQTTGLCGTQCRLIKLVLHTRSH
jgi:hypothetical protein